MDDKNILHENIKTMYPLLKEKIRTIEVISDNSLDLLLNSARPKKLKKGDYLFAEGSICTNVYFVEKGLLRTFYNKDGKDINLNFSLDNTFTTNLKSLQQKTPSEYAIQACEESTILAFDKEELLKLYEQSSEINSFGRKLLELLLAEQEEHANLFKLYTPTERYHFLAENKPELLQRISLSQLSSYIGISRETVSRIRRR
ncbi:Crp/Fnr family transcriptional regulator [Rubrolithibacter danxiaensis]|uniref:Crp/Fnr family transcriptional regulator n=1 Tax=Rubrolithibacter danxiaensis TaxID=3390805 RepID=UPI003BF82089